MNFLEMKAYFKCLNENKTCFVTVLDYDDGKKYYEVGNFKSVKEAIREKKYNTTFLSVQNVTNIIDINLKDNKLLSEILNKLDNIIKGEIELLDFFTFLKGFSTKSSQIPKSFIEEINIYLNKKIGLKQETFYKKYYLVFK